ncbi:type II toxin-antitoxin system VapC family toxin [Neorhizobium galegae]|uniref:Putative nucleic acid-binding PilT-like protein n=1 Tax=Neorhizobium galegae bv. orientalis str. HAMBI 540 TaxID=1028800 RepID=A0A068SS81_NEOGA|nr:type II toxin-antitoxin system VapC family toxin [Neorhizobium galegae]MCQ1850429.1 type II toxin-antitoxin system VapC family toxin [Neorhizobium galegae]CDN49167.1 Putative nucleic acid-binding PilT-like protein [Neorhizobium galegae bv. orientalis str. HAMBI 540]CDZ53949.1 Putative nucleic acid-binding protein, contains PIN domain containing protein [Neorhizobium galegae bv. orientalis]
MTSTVVDTNVLIDMLGSATPARTWSLRALKRCAEEGELILNPVIWSELSASPLSELEIVLAFGWLGMKRETLSYDAAFQAGKAHFSYRRSGGLRERTLPDFLIGAHAVVRSHRLLTRDAARYRAYFPSLDIISPETHP